MTTGEREAAQATAWYARKPWLARYPANVPHELELDPAATARTILDAACARYAGQVVFDLFGSATSYADWQRDAEHLARWFVHACGFQPGQRVLLMVPNLPAFPIAMYAAWRAGLVVVPLHTSTTAPELREPIADSAPVAIVGYAPLLPTFRGAVAADSPIRVVAVPELGAPADATPGTGITLLPDALAVGAALPATTHRVAPGDLALLQYTSGTTGVSKAVMTTHRNLVAQTELLRRMFVDLVEPGADLALAAHPFFHSLGIAMNLLQYPSNGACNVLFPRSRDYDGMVEVLAQRPVQSMVGGPALYHGLLHARGFERLAHGGLRACFVGGMTLRAELMDRWEAATRAPMIEGYGLTEVAGAAIVQFAAERRRGSVGLPGPGLDLTVRDRRGKVVAPGAEGEIWVRGPYLMPGYYGKPAETARVLTEGWFHTGDVGRVDADGYVYLLDRTTDIIVNANANIYPSEIEAVVGAHPGVADVCVVGMLDDAMGEVVRVVVVRRDPALTAADVATWCEPRLADFKRPRAIEFRDALPRSAVGKVLRRAIRDG